MEHEAELAVAASSIQKAFRKKHTAPDVSALSEAPKKKALQTQPVKTSRAKSGTIKKESTLNDSEDTAASAIQKAFRRKHERKTTVPDERATDADATVSSKGEDDHRRKSVKKLSKRMHRPDNTRHEKRNTSKDGGEAAQAATRIQKAFRRRKSEEEGCFMIVEDCNDESARTQWHADDVKFRRFPTDRSQSSSKLRDRTNSDQSRSSPQRTEGSQQSAVEESPEDVSPAHASSPQKNVAASEQAVAAQRIQSIFREKQSRNIPGIPPTAKGVKPQQASPQASQESAQERSPQAPPRARRRFRQDQQQNHEERDKREFMNFSFWEKAAPDARPPSGNLLAACAAAGKEVTEDIPNILELSSTQPCLRKALVKRILPPMQEKAPPRRRPLTRVLTAVRGLCPAKELASDSLFSESKRAVSLPTESSLGFLTWRGGLEKLDALESIMPGGALGTPRLVSAARCSFGGGHVRCFRECWLSQRPRSLGRMILAAADGASYR
jgi:hypothetical protein